MSRDTETKDLETTSLAACVANMVGEEPARVPKSSKKELRLWLGQRNLGLVPVDSPEGFSWPGSFLGRRRASGTWAVYFGVPPGIIFDPSPNGERDDTVDAAFVLAPHDPARETALGRGATGAGAVELIALSTEAEGPMEVVSSAEALAGRGLRGDRYAEGAGTFSDPGGRGYDLTLVEAEALEELAAGGVDLSPEEARRNLVVRGVSLDDLIGYRFRVGEVECFGQRRCEPCAHLEKLTQPGVLRGLVHRGGLRADVISSGEIRVGDSVQAAP